MKSDLRPHNNVEISRFIEQHLYLFIFNKYSMLMMSKHPNPNSITLKTEEKIESGQRPSCKILVKQSVSENSMNL